MQDTQMSRRIFIATFISFLVFMAYDYLVVQPQLAKQASTNTTIHTKQTTTDTTSQTTDIKSVDSLQNKVITTIESDAFKIQIDNLGRISDYILEKNIFNDSKGKKLHILSKELPKVLEIRFKNEALNKEAFNTPVSADKTSIIIKDKPQTLTLTQHLKTLTITKVITFYPDGHYDLKLNLSKPAKYFLAVGRVNANVNMYAFHGALLVNDDDSLEMIDDGEGEVKTFTNIKIAANVDQYYTTFLYNLKNKMTVYETIDNLKNQNPLLFIQGDQNLDLHGYIGPKYVKVLENINPTLTKVVEYGIMTFMAKPMFYVLNRFYEMTGNWGVAIILFVVLVRILLFPLTYRGMVSMYKMKLIAPKLQELKVKYAKDPKKFQIKTMELYRRENVNPLGGCLPLLIQIPIFFSIYRVLVNAIELKGASFLWIHDLSSMDPYFILPVLMGVTMYAHQMITPNNFTDPMQEKIFKFLPVIFTFFMATFSAGLVLYWTVNNILSFIQQYIINKSMEAKGLMDKNHKRK
ncbi:MAG: membrane protein insertase YidC [Epsilonproteobacteria bacterium]|nr:membrane protein insertase YidC [Campylobacterota bacterium]